MCVGGGGGVPLSAAHSSPCPCHVTEAALGRVSMATAWALWMQRVCYRAGPSVAVCVNSLAGFSTEQYAYGE